MSDNSPVEFKDDAIAVLGDNLMPPPDYVVPKTQIPAAVSPQETSPMAMMMQAKQAGFSVEEIREMMDLQDRNDTRLAKQAFYQAMAEFKRNPPQIVKDKLNSQFSSSYVSIGNMVNTVNEHMGPFGLSARWDFPETGDKGLIKCTCYLCHELGHEIHVSLDSPVDNSGAKNPLQGRKSTRTYLKLETFEAVTGMASEEGNVNDDGNGSSQPKQVKLITENQQNTIHSTITENNLNMNIIVQWLGAVMPGVDSIANIPAANYPQVIQKLKKAIEGKK